LNRRLLAWTDASRRAGRLARNRYGDNHGLSAAGQYSETGFLV
jgi:hypothetical protein